MKTNDCDRHSGPCLTYMTSLGFGGLAVNQGPQEHSAALHIHLAAECDPHIGGWRRGVERNRRVGYVRPAGRCERDRRRLRAGNLQAFALPAAGEYRNRPVSDADGAPVSIADHCTVIV